MISDAQFMQWLRNQASKITTLVEINFVYQAAGPVATLGTIYLADRPYTTKANDSPANTPYRDVIRQAPDISRAIDLNRLGGRGVVSVGTLALDNADGSLDFLLETIMDGRGVRFYIGDASWARADFRLAGIASLVTVRAANDTAITVAMRDRNFLLDAAVIGGAIPSGPNAGKPKPILLGSVYNFDLTAYLLDASGPTYIFNNFASPTWPAGNVVVRDAGVSLDSGAVFSGNNAAITANAGTDTITRVAHGLVANDVIFFSGVSIFAGLAVSTQYWVISAGLTADDFRLSLTKGGAAVDITGTTFSGTVQVSRRRFYVDATNSQIQLSSAPTGRLTMDVDARLASGTYALLSYPHNAFRYLMDLFLTIADRDDAAFDVLRDLEINTSIAWGRAILDRTNLLDLFDEIAVASDSWYAWTSAGLLTAGRLDLPNLDAATAVDSIVAGEMDDSPSCENLPLQFGRLILDAGYNVVVQTDGLATTVSASDRTLYGQQYQLRVTTTDPPGADYPNDWWNYHRSVSGTNSVPLGTKIYAAAVVAQQQCDERTELFRPWTRVFRCTVGLDKYALNPGDCVTVTYPRYGLSAGKKFRVISIDAKPSDRKVDLVLVRRTIPDYLTSSHV